MRLLLIEEDPVITGQVLSCLDDPSVTVDTVDDGALGLRYAKTGTYDLIIANAAGSQMNGCHIARYLRSERNPIPILLLVTKNSVSERIDCLNSGGSLYLEHPFTKEELNASVHSLLSRFPQKEEVLSFGYTVLNTSTRMLSCKDCSVLLTQKESETLRLLFLTGCKNRSKESLLHLVWGTDSPSSGNTLEVYIGFLRKKLHSIHSDLQIRSIRNLGYHLEKA